MEKKFKIGDIAKQAGLNIETIRFYERRGLILPVARTGAGYRIYDENALSRLRFIKNAKEIGFTLKEIDELLKLKINPKSKCGDIRKRAEKKLQIIHAKMAVLESIRKVLKKLIEDCQSGLPTEACPILKSMEREKKTQ